MPGVVRNNLDKNVKHLDPLTPLPAHQTPYVKTNGNVFVNDAQVVAADIEADNGVIHVINKVLIPE